MLEILGVPFLACIVLAGIHVYLGLHVLARGVIFVDLALAQVAALGITVAFLQGHALDSPAAYWYALAFAVAAAGLLAASRTQRVALPQEAIIGIVYVVSAAAVVVVLEGAPEGGERIKQLLVGNILTVTPAEIAAVAALYAAVGALHWLVRRPLLEISLDPDGARARGRCLPLWDMVFYVSFALVVTSSVRLAGVLLVFAYLVVPAALAALWVRAVAARLVVGWIAGLLASAGGLAAAYRWDLPTGASVVTVLGALMAGALLLRLAATLAANARTNAPAALRGATLVLCAAVALAGLLLLVFPGMDHLWLDAIEAEWPAARAAFLTPAEREADTDSRRALAQAQAELSRLRARQEDARWGRAPLPPETEERLRQFLAGRGEIAAGDRLVLATHRARARGRQRVWLGLPLLLLGAGGLAALVARGRARS